MHLCPVQNWPTGPEWRLHLLTVYVRYQRPQSVLSPREKLTTFERAVAVRPSIASWYNLPPGKPSDDWAWVGTRWIAYDYAISRDLSNEVENNLGQPTAIAEREVFARVRKPPRE